MKKILLIIVLILIAVGFYYYRAKEERRLEQRASVAWEQARSKKSISGLKGYIQEFSKSIHLSEAQNLLDSLEVEKAWLDAKEQDNLQAFLDFRAHHPGSRYEPQLKEVISNLEVKEAWENAIANRSIQALKEFRGKYPNSPYDKEASKGIIDLEVEKIFSGRHGTLPPAQVDSYSATSKSTTIEIENGTSFTLTIWYSGIRSQKLVLKPNTQGSLVLPNGRYRVAASVNAPNVLPFAGEQDLKGGNYSSDFYIRGY